MRYVLDTNVISELRRGQRADQNVIAWVATVPDTDMFLSAITVFELALGVTLIERRDRVQGGALRRWLEDRVLALYVGRILPFETGAALRCGALHVPAPRPDRDSMIAATAMNHGMVVATRDVADFRPMGVPVINPWDA